MKKYTLIIAVFFSIGISGCKKDYLGLEVNPNQPSVSPPGITLAGALVVAASIPNGSYPTNGIWIQHWTNSGNYVPSPSQDQFQITNTSFTGVWATLYQNVTNFNNLQVTAEADPTLAYYEAISIIMKVYDFQQLVDQFGDIPYSQAFNPTTHLNPAYDPQQTIYNDLVKQLDAAIALAGKTGATNPTTNDIVYGGNMVNWQKFANSLKLRLAIRQSTKFPTAGTGTGQNAAAADLASTASIGYLDDTQDAEANPGYSNTLASGNSAQSPFWATDGFQVTGNSTFPNTYLRGNNFFIKALTNFNDPRLTQIYAPAGGGVTTIEGNYFGQTVNVLTNSFTASIGPGLLISPTQNAVLMGGGEACFLLAEGILDGYITTGMAQDYYQRGITASFVAMQVGSTPALSQAAAATYYGQNITNVGWAASSNKEEAIIYQKWIALTGFGDLEAYLEYERTGYPVLPNPVSEDPAAESPTLPVRQFYPLSEESTNSQNLTKEGTINIFTTKIFWEK
jgi:hypothetical protein